MSIARNCSETQLNSYIFAHAAVAKRTFHGPEKKREDNAVACQAFVQMLWKPPAPAASETTRPQLRRLAKSSLDLDAGDMPTFGTSIAK